MIDASRFLIRSTEYEGWLDARRHGVSATAVASAATPAGFRETVTNWGESVEVNDYMRFGSESEAELMRFAHQEHGILPSDWLIAGENPRHLATPDGLSLDHTLIAEAKTTGTDWGDKPPIKYRRQVQFQLKVTQAERCLFLWNLRVPDGDYFRLGWWEPKFLWIDRDETMIADLTRTADELLEALHGELQSQ